MSDTHLLHAQPREVHGRHLGALRKSGMTPAVLYGKGVDPVSLQVATKEFLKVAQAAGTVETISMQIEGEAAPRGVRIQALQRHVTRLSPTHIDFICA